MLRTTMGPYRIDSELGSGGMGRVYLARATERGAVPAGARVALKVIHPHLLSEPGFFKRFLREAEIGKAVAHPNVVRCHDADAITIDGVQHNFLVMEYVEGQTLRDLLDEMEIVPEELCRHIGREVSRGLAAIHVAGAVHRDLKPENVLITPDHQVKIMDLGVARLADEAIRLSRTGAFVGSPQYAAPEQYRGGGEDLDGRTDLHALGLILYELSSGLNPYFADDVHQVLRKVLDEQPRRLGEVNPQLSPFFEEVVHCLLAKDREGRFDSAEKLLDALEAGENSTWWGRRARDWRAETKRPLRRIRIPRETAVYGREGELEALDSLYRRAKSGEGRVVLIEGEAGIGKTRLVDEFIGRLRQGGEDLNFLFGSYPPGGAATVSGAWSTAYREHFGGEGLEETLAEYLTITPVLIPAFGALLRGEPPPEGTEPLTKDSVQTVFVHATRALAEERPTVVLLEDLHFAPEEGLGLFASLALAVPEHRILLVGTARPGIPDEWRANLERAEPASRMQLSRLGPKDLAKLLEDSFQSRRLADELGMQIARKSDGNPFFVFEFIRGLREGRFITRRPDGTWVTTRVIAELEIPSSVQDLIQARIADLDESEQEILDVAACCGFEFDPGLVAEAIGEGKIPVLRRLGHLERAHRLVRSAGDGFVFDHHQVQEALYARISPPLRKEYHAAIGGALQARNPEPQGALAVELCDHLLRGSRGPDALRHLDRALDHLEAGYQNDQAVALADRALETQGLLSGVARAEILLRKAGRLDYLGRRDGEDAALREAVAIADAEGGEALRGRAHHALGGGYLSRSRYEEAHEEHLLARDLARQGGDRKHEGRATVGMGLALAYLGRYEEARVHQEDALALAVETGDRRSEALAAGNLGTVLHYGGRTEEALAQYERSLAIAHELGSRDLEVNFTGNLGGILGSLGRTEAARDRFERCHEVAREIGSRKSEGAAVGNLAVLSLNLGLLREALERFERGLEIDREIGARLTSGIALVNLGPLHARLGDFTTARERLDRALAVIREIGARREEGYVLHAKAEVAVLAGDLERAALHGEEALALRRDLNYLRGIARTRMVLGRVRLEEGRPDEARAHLTEAFAAGREDQVPGATVLAAALMALLPGGDPALATETFRENGSRLGHQDRMEARFLLFRTTGDLAHLAEARRLLEHLRDHAPGEYRESMLVNVPVHREILAAWEEHGVRE